MKVLRFILSNFRGTALIATGAGIISGACSAVLITLINGLLTGAISRGAGTGLKFMGLCLLVITCTIISQMLLVRFAEDSCYRLRVQLSRRILAAPLRRLEEAGMDRLLVALKQDISQISNVLTGVPTVITSSTVVICCLIYLSWLSAKLLLIVFGFLLVGITVNRLLVRKGSHYLKLGREEVDTLFKHMRALTSGIKELKLHRLRRDAFMSDGLEQSARTFRELNVRGMSFHVGNVAWSQVLYFVFVGLLLFVIADMNIVSTSVLTGYALTILYMMGYLGSIVNAFPMLNRASINLSKIEALGLSLGSLTEERSPAGPPAQSPSWQSIDLRGVTHSYQRERDDSDFVLGPIDMSVKPNELVFIVGGNGSGKTTLAKLLCGLYVQEEGEVRFNGQAVTDLNRDLYREMFSVVFSDFFLFESFFGIKGPESDFRARQYLAKLHLDHKVQIENGAVSTLELSQGQRKRLALLTAYLEDRPVYIFDEWAADQDPFFKEIFYHELLPELKSKGKTVLAITHDDRYYYLADRLIKLDYGKIVPYYGNVGVQAVAQADNAESVL